MTIKKSEKTWNEGKRRNTPLHRLSNMFISYYKKRKIASLVLYFLLYFVFRFILKPFLRKRKNIIAFAHMWYTGDIKQLYEKMKHCKDVKVYFVTKSKEELERLKSSEVDAYYYMDKKAFLLFSKTDVWITATGCGYIPFVEIPLIFRKIFGVKGSKWVDTWHAVDVLKGPGKGRAKMLKYYDVGFVSSDFYKQYFSSKEEGILDKLKVTGFPRTDPLISNSFNRDEIIKELGIPQNKKNILYAPSWGNPAAGENEEKALFPFESDKKILEDTDKMCIKNNCNFIIRMHPMWETEEKEYAEKIIEDVKKSKNIFYLPFKKYPVTEPILFISDILITDYSSIANDFTLLNRSIIFIDTEVPTENFFIQIRDRVGYIAKNKNDFFNILQNALDSPEQFIEEFKEKRQEFLRKVCKYLDGRSSQRCVEEIIKLIVK